MFGSSCSSISCYLKQPLKKKTTTLTRECLYLQKKETSHIQGILAVTAVTIGSKYIQQPSQARNHKCLWHPDHSMSVSPTTFRYRIEEGLKMMKSLLPHI